MEKLLKNDSTKRKFTLKGTIISKTKQIDMEQSLKPVS